MTLSENSVPMEEENAASDSLMEMLQALEENNQLGTERQSFDILCFCCFVSVARLCETRPRYFEIHVDFLRRHKTKFRTAILNLITVSRRN